MGKRRRERQQRGRGQRATAIDAPTRPASWDPAGPGDDDAPPKPWRALCREHWLPVVVIAAAALAVRPAALAFVAHSPYREVSNIDSEAYERLAKEILTTGWLPTRHFYGAPAYQYFLAAAYKLFGQGPLTPRIIQILLGSTAAVALYAIGARLFVRRVGWLGGLGLACYGPLNPRRSHGRQDGAVRVGRTDLFWAFPAARAEGRPPRDGALRMAARRLRGGCRPMASRLLALGVIAGFVPTKLPSKRRVLVSAVFLGSGVSAFGPVAAWNTYKGGGLLLTTSDSGLNFYPGNNERATGFPARPPGLRDIPKYEEDDASRVGDWPSRTPRSCHGAVPDEPRTRLSSGSIWMPTG